ncbi:MULTISPECIES: LapA family protein [unclassified Agarivorans]|uniref:LapA family protein n=1 Tax=unclassified Agarivorans TaxID=2636026 RepID=UPI003D7C9A74
MKAIFSTLLLVVLFVLALALGAQNEQIVSVNYLIAESSIRLSWLMAGLFISGFVCCLLFLLAFYTRIRIEKVSLKRRLVKQQKQLNKLQNETVKDN